ncbi:fibronectin type III domain protein [Bacteriovorax sp. BSW11_IV]|uniref:fibronectin type III domain-containing protein n=1 Tax=Bacteriovorax sp. BSW11_IV TaxID=1353529 RepID=UPI00038A49B6|nr:fibronectin type III domain-containing protein [Bacteriovorax sp. BSW11_IV]EQC45226.1 fibronectin type III domain protein [Bacteriovorax sp. BSW11_IV]
MKLSKILLLVLSFSLFACKPADQEKVKVKTAGIFEPVEIEVQGGLDRGEFLIGSDPDVITISVQNNSTFPLTDLNLVFEEEESNAGVKFNPDEEGKSASPGYLGTCASRLETKQKCYFKLSYSPTISGNLKQIIFLKYKNLVDSKQETFELTMFAGEAASLVFTSEQINYSFGVIERSDREVFKQRLIIENAGGLTAKEMILDMINNPVSNSYQITENTCGNELKAKERCEMEVIFTPMNWGDGAPDGNIDQYYYSNISIPYIRDPYGKKSVLNAYFSVKSFNIKGLIKHAGLAVINFDDLIVGNFASKPFKIKNEGDKEAILHYIDIKNAGGVIIGSCVKVAGQDLLECRDPAQIAVAGASVALPTLPFKVRDVNNCITPYDSLNYSRDAEGAITDSSVIEVAGVVGDSQGQSCLFDLILHPSTTFETSGDFSGWTLTFVYDSTWKGFRDMMGVGGPSNFNVGTANYFSAAKINTAFFEYAGDNSYSNLDAADNGIFSYDLGRVSLISDAAYKQQAKFRLKNMGDNVAEVLSIRDGQNFNITDTSQNINNYYLSASHSGCAFVSPKGGECDVRFQIAPVASSNPDGILAKAEEDAQMFDDVPTETKKFYIEYKDGTTYNDDLTLRTNRIVEVKMKAKLVRKGFLVFEDTSSNQGVIPSNKIAGNTEYFHVKLKNVGTGPIPYIEAVNGKMMVRPNNNAYPFEIVDRPGPASGASKDCYELINFTPANHPISTTPYLGQLQPGENCTLSVRMKLRSTDIYAFSLYSEETSPEWERKFSVAKNGTSEAWEYYNYNGSDQLLSFKYYDGDGVSDPANGYYPTLENYGNFHTISGGTNGDYRVNIKFVSEGYIVPTNPFPSLIAILYRQPVSLPFLPVDGWGDSVAMKSVPLKWRDISKLTGAIPATFFSTAITHTASLMSTTHTTDYAYHGGTYPTGGSYTGAITLSRKGANINTGSINMIANNGDPEIGVTLAPDKGSLQLAFNPTNAGVYTKEVTIQYFGGRKTLDENTLVYSNTNSTISIKLFFEATDENKTISLGSQAYTVYYDTGTESVIETLDGATESYSLDVMKMVPNQTGNLKAIKGSEVYAKKRFVVTNTSPYPINRVDAMIKRTLDSSTVENSAGGLGYSLTSNTCSNKALLSGENCYIDVKLKASTSEPDLSTRILAVTYEIADKQYLISAINLNFQAASPAKVKVAGVNSESINNELGGVIQGSYPVKFGYYQDTLHPVLNDSPFQEMLVQNIVLTNNVVEKASFLHQYRTYVGNMNAVLPAGAYVTMYDDGENTVSATRACFYGDNEGGPLPSDEWGFNQDSASPCVLKVLKKFNDDFIAQKLPAAFNYVKLTFYNSGRSSVDNLYLHFQGFVEPNRSNSTGDIMNVVATDEGDLSFSWNDYTPSNPGWGAITGYRVFYSATKTALNNLFETSASFTDTTSPEVVLSGLVPSRYYYIRIAAKRLSPGGSTYLSISNMTTREVVIPPQDMFYDYDLKVVVDTYISPKNSPLFGTKSEVVTGCDKEISNVVKNGAMIQKRKKLVNSTVFDVIKSDPSLSNYTYQVVPHWMSDPVTDIAPIFAPVFNCSETTGNTPDLMTFYMKSCSDCSCNQLSKIDGGDGENLPPSALFYVDANASSAAQRCYFTQ